MAEEGTLKIVNNNQDYSSLANEIYRLGNEKKDCIS